MNIKFLVAALLTFCIFSQIMVAQTDKPDADVTVFESVLNTASWANFKYQDQLALAKKGDYKATRELLDFSGTVDGRAALDHSVTLLELIAAGGDRTFASAVNLSKPKLKTILLDRLQLAQGRTKKTALQKPMAEWAPMTWEVLNGKPFVPRLQQGEENIILDANTATQKKRDLQTGGSNSSAIQNTILDTPTAEKPKGKQ